MIEKKYDRIQTYYDELSFEEKEILHNTFKSLDQASENYQRFKSVIFKKTPPTPEEFLDWRNGWLPQAFAESIFQWVKEDFLQMTTGKKHYSQIVLYGSTRQGKSFCAILLMLYIIVYTHHLRDMARFYGLAGGTSLSLYILSFNYNKVSQLYLAPLYTLMEQSSKFIQVKFQDQVKIDQEKYGCEKIVYSKAAVFGHLTLASGLRLVSGNSDALSIIGNNILCGIISEIAFFIENDGATEEEIFRLYSDLVERIKATVGKNYLAFTFLDTSANTQESVIESYILNNLSKKEDVLFRWRRRWDIPELVKKFYPIYDKTKETFPLCIGDGTFPAKILEPYEIKDFPESLIEYPPIDSKDDFERNLIKSIKDICGKPTTLESKFIQRNILIDNIFIDDLMNEVSGIVADTQVDPNMYILNHLIDKYFVAFQNVRYIKRAPKEPRYAGADLAFAVKGDVAGLSIGHKEWSREMKKVIYVSDFTFAILPGENGINIEVIGYFIKNLGDLGVPFANVVFDSFQSEQLHQFLNRWNIPNMKNSVDISINPYMNFFGLLLSGQIKSGRNIFLRNNLKSLYRIGNNKNVEKIDHSKGQLTYTYSGDWDKSTCGVHAKDVSDAKVNWVYIASQDNFMPNTIFEDENERLNRIQNNTVSDTSKLELIRRNNYNSLVRG